MTTEIGSSRQTGTSRYGIWIDGWKSQLLQAPKVQRQINKLNPVEYLTSSALLPGPLFFLHSFPTSALMSDEHLWGKKKGMSFNT